MFLHLYTRKKEGMLPFKRLVGNEMWRALEGCSVLHSTVLFQSMVDLHPKEHDPTFPNAETVLLENCDGNTVFYHLRKGKTFPKVKEVWMNTTPDECMIRIVKDFDKVYLTKRFTNNVYCVREHLRWTYPNKFRLVDDETFQEKVSYLSRVDM